MNRSGEILGVTEVGRGPCIGKHSMHFPIALMQSRIIEAFELWTRATERVNVAFIDLVPSFLCSLHCIYQIMFIKVKRL